MINSIRQSDYEELSENVEMLKSVYKVLLKANCTIEIGNLHRFWEYGSALKLVPRNGTVLDVGSGFSLFGPASSILLNAEVVECEPNKFMTVAREQVNHFLAKKGYTRLEVRNKGFGSLPDFEFDVVACISVLEHVPEIIEMNAWIELGERVKPGGFLFVTVDCVPQKQPYGYYHFDNLRCTNYTLEMLKERYQSILSRFRDFEPIGVPDFEYNGDQVFNYSFFRMGFKRCASH